MCWKNVEVFQLTVFAVLENLQQVFDFAEQRLLGHAVSTKEQNALCLAIEEVFVNIVHYAYVSPDTYVSSEGQRIENDETAADVTIESCWNETGDTLRFRFIDRGKPYNPLEREAPDVTLSAEKRPVGGLGIYLAKKSVDKMDYEFKEGCNILTLYKTPVR